MVFPNTAPRVSRPACSGDSQKSAEGAIQKDLSDICSSEGWM